MSRFRVDHRLHEYVSVTVGAVEIARYVYEPDIPAEEAPKPYLHPIRALSGAVVSGYRPHDHPWHKGIQLTGTEVSGQNFWGGYSYVRGEGYQWLDNIGRMQHDSFESITSHDGEVHLRENLTWVTAHGASWIAEERQWRIHGLNEEQGLWVLDFSTSLQNTSGRALVFGSPGTEGRDNAGYTGFFWRGPRSFAGGTVHTIDRHLEDAERSDSAEQSYSSPNPAMGSRSPWLSYSSPNDETDGGCTLLFFAGSASHSDLSWFVRSAPIAVVNPSPAFTRTFSIEQGETLRLQHRVVIVDRILDRSEIEALAEQHELVGVDASAAPVQ